MGKYRVLIVEDDKSSAEMLGQLVRNVCKDVVVTNDGLSAYKVFLEDKIGFDLVISDIQMPNMNGLEFLRNVRSQNPHIPIVIISAFDEKEYLLSAIDLKVEKYLTKPIARDSVIAIIKHCFEKELLDKEKFLYRGTPCSYESKTRILQIGEEQINLTKNENKLLSLLFSRRDYKGTYKELSYFIWEDKNENLNRIHSLVRRVRKKATRSFIGFSSNDDSYFLNIDK